VEGLDPGEVNSEQFAAGSKQNGQCRLLLPAADVD
jgi:hypothetical protein